MPEEKIATPTLDAPGPVLEPGHTYGSVTDKISSIVLTQPTSRTWFIGFGVAFSLMLLLFYSIGYLLMKGVGIWGLNIPVGWGFAIINFVWWVGIGHADLGHFAASAPGLAHVDQPFRRGDDPVRRGLRGAVPATAPRTAMAGLLDPALSKYDGHLAAPLLWDVFAISTYATVSLLFWFIGLIPDLATLRDRARSRTAQIIYGILAMGWRGSAIHWHRYETAYLLLAGLATPLVISVHTVVSFDFAVSIVPGWHTTVFPPYFVAGAIYSGFAMVMTLAIPIRKFYGLQDFITMRHLNNMAKVILATGMIVGYGYMMEAFIAWYSGSVYEQFMVVNRMKGPYAPYYWALIVCNIVTPQVLWSQRVRRSVPVLFVISLIVNVGMWLECYIIVVTSLHRDFLPSSWGMYSGTFWDWSTYIGSIGLFLTLLFLFLRFLPMISIFEMRTLVQPPETAREP